ncbi:MAG: hypothetical protein AVDCRST_MAG67-4451 [uncultured Solirubrobacteraceae bacterium]|uniref:DUF1565 domain-containing protein n=1 Tax=uncultured Solirubrobacteraceae bacterium TaxID=1162706 RepID=A0A6J4TV91_9ACTN|nr:MAG: hypothetical protein AVDCRST_MAG67-4451 [uncultured Solirubrobacteraceae bacterium]
MSRPGRRSLSIAAAVAAGLVAPAAANAATYTVAAGGGACGSGGDVACESLSAAAAAVNAGSGGDTINVSPGTYTENPTFSVPAITITGSTAAPGTVVIGTISFTGAGAASVLEKVVVLTPAGGAPGVSVGSASGGLALRDAIVFNAGGAGMEIAGGTANSITRSSVITNGSAANAVDIQTGTSEANLVLDSSIISGGGAGAGISAKTGVGAPVLGSAKPINITGRQITIAGSATAVSLDARDALPLLLLGTPVGSIAATFRDSIVLGGVATQVNTLPPANSATAEFPNTDRTTPADQLFVNAAKKNFHLRAGAPAIDTVPTASSTSPTDVDGQARTNGPASDRGADEFHVGPPPPAPPTGTGAPQNDGTPPAIVISKPKANQKIKLTTTKKRTVTRNGERVTRRTTTRLKRLAIAGTAKDASGVKGVVLTIEKLGTTSTTKCKWFNPAKGIVLRSCKKPPLVLAKLAANGTWTYNVNARRLSAGKYRVIAVGADNSGAFGNSAARGDAIRRFTLTKK